MTSQPIAVEAAFLEEIRDFLQWNCEQDAMGEHPIEDMHGFHFIGEIDEILEDELEGERINSDPGLLEGSIKHALGAETSHVVGTAKADAQEPGPAPAPNRDVYYYPLDGSKPSIVETSSPLCVGCGENPAQYCHACYEREL